MGISDEELLALLSEEDRREWFALSAEDKEAVRDSYTPHVPPTEQLQGLTRQLFERVRRRQWRFLRRQDFEGAKIHACLDNAIAWVETHPGDRLAYGYIYFHLDYRFPHVRFTPHVAVLTKNDEWIDVTPHGAEGDHPFLQHAGTDGEFHAAFGNGPMDLIYR